MNGRDRILLRWQLALAAVPIPPVLPVPDDEGRKTSLIMGISLNDFSEIEVYHLLASPSTSIDSYISFKKYPY